MADGMTSFEVDDDMLLRNLSAEVESRIHELSDFLTQGGILVYFLARPFVIEGPSLALDNYYWLESLAPDQPVERNVRHMSAVSHGRLVEPTGDGLQSEFGPYLSQHGLEWNTIIRTDFLTEGYHVLAEAGARKCIAGQLFIVESNGRVVFLPSPYSPDFDRVLIDGLNLWYQQKEPSEAELDAEKREAAARAAQELQGAAPQTGPELFDKEQGEPVAVGASLAADLLSETPPRPAPAKTTDTSTSIPAASSPFALNTAMNADEIVESVSQEARRFEEEVASKVTEAKRATGSIDLSIFAQTAKQLVEKQKEPEVQPAAAPTPPPAAPIPAPAPPPAPATVSSDSHPHVPPAPPMPPAFIAPAPAPAPAAAPAPAPAPAPVPAPISAPAPAPTPTPPPPAPPAVAAPAPLAIPEPVAPPPAASPVAQPTPQPHIGDIELTSNNDASDNNSNADVEQHQQHAEPTPQTIHPPASVSLEAPVSPKPLLNTLFKKEPVAQPEAPPPLPQPTAAPQPQAQRSPLGSLMQPVQSSSQLNDGRDKPPAQVSVPARVNEGAIHMTNVPEWCSQFSFSYLDDLKREQSALAGQLHDIQAKLNTVESRIASVDQLKCALLAGDPEVLRDACSTVLGRLGWTVSHSNTVDSELLLSNVTKPESLARIVRSESHCNRSEVAQLAESAISFWDEHEVEPKGILLACTWSNVAPSSRNQQDFTDAVAEFARKKNLCLMTTLQLLGIYRDIELGLATPDAVRQQMLETNGRLAGFAVESALVAGRA